MNGPNDLWIDRKNGIYFTDPYYQRDYWTRKKPELDKQQVYYLAPGKADPVMVADSFNRPNGIVGTKDGKTRTWPISVQERSINTASIKTPR